MKKAITAEIITSLLVLLFVYAGFSKLADLTASGRAMHNQPFPGWLADILVWAVPAAELLVAAGLLFTRTRRSAVYAFLVLMGIFTVYIAAILLRLFPRVPCSCGGVIRSLGWGQHLAFNLFFTGLAAALLVLDKRERRLP